MGNCLLAMGVAGCLLPVVPGVPFLLAGAAVLGANDPRVRRIVALWTRLSRRPTADGGTAERKSDRQAGDHRIGPPGRK
jgi:hypothetical protein